MLPVEDLGDAVLAQRRDALVAGQALDLEDAAAGGDQVAQLVVHDEHLVEAEAAAVAGAEALGAADRLEDLEALAGRRSQPELRPASVGAWCVSLRQCGQRRRTSRWATKQRQAAATR